jgi:hypothetical protein
MTAGDGATTDFLERKNVFGARLIERRAAQLMIRQQHPDTSSGR